MHNNHYQPPVIILLTQCMFQELLSKCEVCKIGSCWFCFTLATSQWCICIIACIYFSWVKPTYNLQYIDKTCITQQGSIVSIQQYCITYICPERLSIQHTVGRSLCSTAACMEWLMNCNPNWQISQKPLAKEVFDSPKTSLASDSARSTSDATQPAGQACSE